MTKEQKEDFDTLYRTYYEYMFKYENLGKLDLNKMPIFSSRENFQEQIQEEARDIKVYYGY